MTTSPLDFGFKKPRLKLNVLHALVNIVSTFVPKSWGYPIRNLLPVFPLGHLNEKF